MTHTRRIWALPALALTLVLAACSTPEDLTAPTLEPQFGTENDDRPVGVAVGPSSATYTLYNYVGPGGYYDDGYDYYYYDHEDVAVLTRYNATGGVVWEREVFRRWCYDQYYCTVHRAEGVFVDANNYTYVLTSSAYNDEPDGPGPSVNFTVHKYAPLGEEVGSYDLGYFYTYRSDVAFELAVDSKGSMYVVAQGDSYEGGNRLAKYTSTGGLVWNRSSSSAPAYGTPYGITVSGSGSIYVVGTQGLARYTSSGDLTWSKAANNSTGSQPKAGNIVISGSYVYTRSGKDIRKYDGTGKQLWLRTQSGLNTLVTKDLAGDSNGNIYVSGKYIVSTGNANAFVRKINASGTTLWTKTYGTSVYDDAWDVATVSGSEIYVIGETQGSLAHTNRGGPGNRDGYLRKLSSSGSFIWTR